MMSRGSVFYQTQWATLLFDLTFAETFAEPKLQSKYLLKSKSEVISLSKNMATNTDSLVN